MTMSTTVTVSLRNKKITHMIRERSRRLSKSTKRTIRSTNNRVLNGTLILTPITTKHHLIRMDRRIIGDRVEDEKPTLAGGFPGLNLQTTIPAAMNTSARNGLYSPSKTRLLPAGSKRTSKRSRRDRKVGREDEGVSLNSSLSSRTSAEARADSRCLRILDIASGAASRRWRVWSRSETIELRLSRVGHSKRPDIGGTR